MIKISLNDIQAAQQLHNIARQLQQPRKLYGVLGETLKKIHAERFKQEVDKILRQDGYLSDKTAYNYNDKNVEFGSDAKYARLHQFGGKAGRGGKVTIPKRPWLGVSEQDEQKLLRKAIALLQRQINQS